MYLIMLFTEEFTTHSTVYDCWYFLHPFLSADVTWYGVVLYTSWRQTFYVQIKHLPV